MEAEQTFLRLAAKASRATLPLAELCQGIEAGYAAGRCMDDDGMHEMAMQLTNSTCEIRALLAQRLSADEKAALLDGLNARDKVDVTLHENSPAGSALRRHHHDRLEASRRLGLKLQGRG